jgi:large subunit ribosomal protein L24
MHVKKNDKVIILAGKDKGQTGEILEVDRKKGRVKVARRNKIVKHKKPNQLTGQAGERIEKEGWLHASNVLLYSEEQGKGVRTYVRYVGQGDALFTSKHEAKASFGEDVPAVINKVRVSKSGELFDQLSGGSAEAAGDEG